MVKQSELERLAKESMKKHKRQDTLANYFIAVLLILAVLFWLGMSVITYPTYPDMTSTGGTSCYEHLPQPCQNYFESYYSVHDIKTSLAMGSLAMLVFVMAFWITKEQSKNKQLQLKHAMDVKRK